MSERKQHVMLKSMLSTDEADYSFQRLCNAYIDEKKAYDAHMAKVAAGDPEYQAYPESIPHPDIAAAVHYDEEAKDWLIDYRIEDDVTPPEPSLDDKKYALICQLRSALGEFAKNYQPTPLKQAAYEIKIKKIAAKALEDRTPEEVSVVEKYVADQKIINDAVEKSAIAESDIDDLTEATIGAYKLPTFSEDAK